MSIFMKLSNLADVVCVLFFVRIVLIRISFEISSSSVKILFSSRFSSSSLILLKLFPMIDSKSLQRASPVGSNSNPLGFVRNSASSCSFISLGVGMGEFLFFEIKILQSSGFLRNRGGRYIVSPL